MGLCAQGVGSSFVRQCGMSGNIWVSKHWNQRHALYKLRHRNLSQLTEGREDVEGGYNAFGFLSGFFKAWITDDEWGVQRFFKQAVFTPDGVLAPDDDDCIFIGIGLFLVFP